MAEALISVLLEQLASVVYQHTSQTVKLVLNAEKDVHNFSSNLKAIQAVLEDAEKKQVMKARVADWLEKLKDVSYEMDNVLDEWNTELLKQQVGEKQEEAGDALVTKKKVCFPMPSGCFCFDQVNKVIYHHNIAKRIKELNEKLTSIAVEREMYDFHQSTQISGHDDHQLIKRHKTSSFVDVSMIFGREEEKQNLLSKLLRVTNRDVGRFPIIPIVGMGGMGKTTLTQLVYNSETVRAHFDKQVWVCVSEPFDEIKIAQAIIENLDKNESQRSSNVLETLLRCIRSLVENKKFLLVLDDVWTEDRKEWENLNLPIIMQSCVEGSTILVTTRKERVVKMMRATSNMIHLDKLSDGDCLALFNSIAFSDWEEGESNELRAIGEKIVRKCQGLPLAVKTLGSLVWDKKTIREWQDVLNSKIWELEEFEEQVFQPLLLSYYDLAPVVKRCLLYCAIFPKDYKLKKYRLIELWMSQNFLISNKNKNTRRIGQDCFESLAMRSFLQDFERDEFGDIVMCKMHDIVHDFVQFLTQKECKIVEGNEKMVVLGGKVRHLTLTSVPYGEFSFPASFYNCENVRTLTFFDSKLETISRDSMLQLKCLRTLRLGGNRWLKEVPREIGGLIHLRYLDLSWSESLKEIPEAVCECINLQTLDLRKCMGLEKLPKAMGKLINLKHLCVWGCSRLRYLPKGIGSLKRLQSLNWFIICVGEDVEAMKLGDLGSMNQLQGSLWIRGLGEKDDDASEIEKAQLGKKEHLSRIGVDFQGGVQRKGDSEIVKAIQPHPNLEYLGIWRCHIITAESLYWINSLHNLRRVSLYDWEFCEVLPPLGKLPSLESLEIQRMKKVKKVEVDFLAREEEEEVSETKVIFPKLKRLSFAGLENWEEWEGITKVDSSEITIMPRLSELTILRCPKLKALPGFLYKIAALQTLTILDCDILAREYEKGVGKEWHNISHIQNLTIC